MRQYSVMSHYLYCPRSDGVAAGMLNACLVPLQFKVFLQITIFHFLECFIVKNSKRYLWKAQNIVDDINIIRIRALILHASLLHSLHFNRLYYNDMPLFHDTKYF